MKAHLLTTAIIVGILASLFGLDWLCQLTDGWFAVWCVALVGLGFCYYFIHGMVKDYLSYHPRKILE